MKLHTNLWEAIGAEYRAWRWRGYDGQGMDSETARETIVRRLRAIADAIEARRVTPDGTVIPPLEADDGDDVIEE